jgi:uncharacterized protein (TIGR03067 family)
MVSLVVAFLCAGKVLAADPPLAGKWQVSSAVRYGKVAGGDVGVIYEFLPGGDLVIRFPGGRNLNGTYKLDREPDPDHIDIETDEDRPDVGGGGPRLGIFMVKEDKLVLCINGAAKKPRPLKPESKAGQLTILLEMKREAK